MKERVRSGEANIHISEAEIASVHESAEACLSDTSAADAAIRRHRPTLTESPIKLCVTVRFMASIRANSRARAVGA